jgi:hypothetical protein
VASAAALRFLRKRTSGSERQGLNRDIVHGGLGTSKVQTERDINDHVDMLPASPNRRAGAGKLQRLTAVSFAVTTPILRGLKSKRLRRALGLVCQRFPREEFDWVGGLQTLFQRDPVLCLWESERKLASFCNLPCSIEP